MIDTRLAARAMLVVLLTAGPTAARADDGLQAARRLYAAAEYEDALKALERLNPTSSDSGALVAVQQQRLLCLVALGRSADAEQAMTAIVQADPLYVPDAAAAPPRVRAAFRDVRAKLVPAIARSEYDRARHAFEAADYATASAGFGRVLAIVESSDAAGGPVDSTLRDIGVLATGFKTLSDKALAPPAPPPASAKAADPEPPSAPVPPAVLRVYDATYPGIEPPTIVRQDVPKWPHQFGPAPNRDAMLELVINEEGRVESARVTRGVYRRYDQALLAAATTWSYTPAQLEGAQVKFRKVIKLNFK